MSIRFTSCQFIQEETSEASSLKAKVENLMKDVEFLKSTDVNEYFQDTNDVDDFYTSEIPPDTIGDEHRDEL